MVTTKSELFRSGEGWWEVTLPLAPVPASRPRVGRFGTYYSPTYAKWKKAASGLLKPYWKDGDPVDDPMYVVVAVIAKRPQKLTRPFPAPDVDNFAKAALDVITSSQLIWEDDKQVVLLTTSKQYAAEGEEPHTFIRAALDEETLFSDGTGEDVYDLPPSLRVSLEEVG